MALQLRATLRFSCNATSSSQLRLIFLPFVVKLTEKACPSEHGKGAIFLLATPSFIANHDENEDARQSETSLNETAFCPTILCNTLSLIGIWLIGRSVIAIGWAIRRRPFFSWIFNGND